MYGLSNGKHLKKTQNGGTLLFQSKINIHIHNPHKNSGRTLAGCIGCCNVLSAATKLRSIALYAFIIINN